MEGSGDGPTMLEGGGGPLSNDAGGCTWSNDKSDSLAHRCHCQWSLGFCSVCNSVFFI